MASLEERITVLEDIRAIERLKAHYAFCADAKYTDNHERKPQEVIDTIAWDQCSVFSEDAVWDNGLFGCFNGKNAIWEFLRATPWKFSVHMFMNPLIDIQGEVATGSWVLWEVATLTESDKAMFLSATLADDYIKIDGSWYTSRVKMTNRFMTPYDEPWTKRRNAPYKP